MKFEPVIKWSGSKRSQSEYIIEKIKDLVGLDGDTYYEPFCGGASILMQLLLNKDKVRFKRYVCSDFNNDLISLWNLIKEHPEKVINSYARMWNELNVDDDKDRKKKYYYSVRDRFNKEKDPCDFMFIMRTTTNGMPRYNKNGEFNNSFHVTRNGIIPNTFEKIVLKWSKILNENNVEFLHRSFDKVVIDSDMDVVYLDPPYANTKGMYYGAIDLENIWAFLRGLPCSYIMSFDGKISNGDDLTHAVPEDIYDSHEYVFSGNSSFRRVIGNSNDSVVSESLYIKDNTSYPTMEFVGDCK